MHTKIENEISKVNIHLKNEYLTYGSYDKLILLYTTNINKYEALTQNYFSIEMARLYYQCSYLIINTGDVEKYVLAEIYLSKAIDIIENVGYFNEEYRNLFSKIYYLYSIIYEHRGNKDKAILVCEDAYRSAEDKHIIQYGLDVILRQIYLLTGEGKVIVDLNKTSMTYDLMEIFQNKRRLFQYYLKLYDIENSTIILKEIEFIFELLKGKIDKIYIGMYYRDLARYYYIIKEKSRGYYYFKAAMKIFEKYEFNGQIKMLTKENDEYKFNIGEK